MITLKRMDELNRRVEYIEDFRGYNHNLRISGNEFFDTQNITADYYPLLSSRQKRARLRPAAVAGLGTGFETTGFLARDKLYWTSGARFVIDGIEKGRLLNADLTAPRTLVGMGSRVAVFPDKQYWDPMGPGFYPLESTYTRPTGCTVYLTTLHDLQTNNEVYTLPPYTLRDGTLLQDATQFDDGVIALRRYSTQARDWVSVVPTCLKMWLNGVGDKFKVNDGITISGFDCPSLNGSFVVADIVNNYIAIYATLETTEGLFRDANHIISAYASNGITIKREVPDMDFVCEWENRLWGCNSAKNEIYASALGDPTNWNQFAGISTDSYAVNVGSPGPFTGCCVYNGQPMFFKEDTIYLIYGNRPSNFQLVQRVCSGVEEGSSRSLCVVNGVLYYKSPFDICAYSPRKYPQSISRPLGRTKYKDVVSGALGKKLYVSMTDENDSRVTFSYDTEYGIWCREDDQYATHYAFYQSDLFFVGKDPEAEVGLENEEFIWSVTGSTEYAVEVTIGRVTVSPKVETDRIWYVETGDIELAVPDHEYVSKLQLRFELEFGSSLRIAVKYDNDPEWVEKYSVEKANKHSLVVPIIPRRCQRMRIRIEGTGSIKIWSFAKTIEGGSEL